MLTFTATATAGSTCRAPAGATAVHRSANAVVYRRQRTATTAGYSACRRAGGRRTVLPGASGSRTLSAFRSAGRYLAFIVDEVNAHDMTAAVGVRVFDLRAGRARRGIALATSPAQPDSLRFRSLVLTAKGTAAWRETGSGQRASTPIDRIAARDVSGRRRILRTAPFKTISRLELVGGATARWRVGDQLQRRRIDTLGR
ncbi:MAG: hypothetical protein WKF42_08475 [Solirubrobacteraceae bacterium]